MFFSVSGVAGPGASRSTAADREPDAGGEPDQASGGPHAEPRIVLQTILKLKVFLQ